MSTLYLLHCHHYQAAQRLLKYADSRFLENRSIREDQKKKKKRKKAAKSTLSFSMDDEGAEDDGPTNGKGKDTEASAGQDETRTHV